MSQELVTNGEVLPPVLTKGETNNIEKRAVAHFSRAQKSVVLFAADLARLQEGQAHNVRGYSQFGEYVESVFEGITSSNASQIVRQGQVALLLERSGRISLKGEGKDLPGTTGLRDLSVIRKKYGEQTMLKVYDIAKETGRKVVSDTVAAAMQQLLGPPEPTTLEPGEPAEDQPEEDEEGYTEENSELFDRLQWLREKVDDASDRFSAGNTERAVEELEKLIEETKEVQIMMKGEQPEDSQERSE